MLIGCFPIFRTWLTVPMIGTVHLASPGLLFQLAVDSALRVRVVWVLVVYARNGCRNIWLKLLRCSSVATDQSWFMSTPAVSPPICLSTTTVGPIENVPVPRRSFVPVG